MSNAWKSAKNVNRALFPTVESLKQGRLSKGFDIVRDYKQTFIDTFKYAKRKPFLASVQLTTLGFTIFASKLNPNMESYHEQLLDASNKHSLVSDLIRNKVSSERLKCLMKYRSEDRLKISNFLIMSIVTLQMYPDGFDSYDRHCNTLHSRWLHLRDWKSRIVDYGFLNRWYMLEKMMMNYDVNDDEFI